MFGTIRKHQTWLWAVIITLTVISFLVYFSPYSKMNSERRAADYGSIGGQRVNEQEFYRARREVDLHYFFMTGRWPEDEKQGFDPVRETYQWLVLSRRQDEMGLHVSDEVAAEMAREMIRPFQRMQVNSPVEFVQKVLLPKGLSVGDWERFIRHYVGIQEMIATLGLSGKLIPPQEVKTLYEREHQELSTEVVLFSASNYLSQVTVLPDALNQFYSNRVAVYRIPDRVQVNYVRFALSNYLTQAEDKLKTNLTDLVEQNYQRLGTNAFPEARTPEEAKAKIREQVLKSAALGEARRQALEFARKVVENPQDFAAAAQTNGLTVGITAPFDREDGPKDVEGGPDFAKAAFSLRADDPVGGPIVGPDGAYVITLNKKLPQEDPPLQQIRTQVLEDYRHEQAVTLARQAARQAAQSLSAGLAAGKGFTNLCADAKLNPLELPPFSISTRSLPEVGDQLSLNQLKQAAFTSAPGKVSNPVETAEGALLLYVRAKLPFDEAKMQADLPGFANLVRRRRQEEAFNEWFGREFNKEIRDGLRNTPLVQPPQRPPANMNASKAG